MSTGAVEPCQPLYSTASTAPPMPSTATQGSVDPRFIRSSVMVRSDSGRAGSALKARSTSATSAPATTVTVAASDSELRLSHR